MEALLPDAGKYLVGQGILGILCMALAYAYWTSRAKVDHAWSERLQDHKAILETMHQNNVVVSDVVESARARTEASHAIARSQELLAAKTGETIVEMGRLRETVAEQRTEIQRVRQEQTHEIQRLREELLRRGLA